MWKQIKSLGAMLLYWMLLFQIIRLVFMLFYGQSVLQTEAGFAEILQTFPAALKLDFATACYFSVFPFLLISIEPWFKKGNAIRSIKRYYTGLLSLAYTLTLGGDLGLYAEWKTKLSYKALLYLEHPTEVYNSASTGIFLVSLLIITALMFAFHHLYKRIADTSTGQAKHWWSPLIFLLFVPPFMVLGMRGGLQEIPINQSQSYFSKHEILNHAAVNNMFNLYISYFENREFQNENPYQFFTAEEAKNRTEGLFKYEKDTTVQILSTQRPNIVLLILESWSGDLIESLGGEGGITPEFAKLEKDGLLFTNIYASGSHSEQGMAAIFSGFPAHAYTSVTVQPDKYPKLPSLTQELMDAGYFSSFYFGGQLIYGNIKSYIIFNGFDRIREVYDFDDDLPRGKLGIHDEYTLDAMARELQNDPQPFFASLFTVSSHSPYDHPKVDAIDWGGKEQSYLNSVYYADSSLGQFFQKARQMDWYSNTLFILVADHSHNSYRNWSRHSAEWQHIPLLFYGDVLKKEYRGKQNSILASQTDLASSLLHQLHLDKGKFPYSRNLFNPYTKQFAYWELTGIPGTGWRTPTTSMTYDHRSKTFRRLEPPKEQQDSMIQDAKAFMQHIFQEYLDL